MRRASASRSINRPLFGSDGLCRRGHWVYYLNIVHIYERNGNRSGAEMAASKVWLITGVSSGFGRQLAQAALARGDVVAGTLRQPAQLAAFEALAPGRARAYQLDVTDTAAVERVVTQIGQDAGRIDVVVNNAGYGLVGMAEEVSEAEARRLLDTNFFGLLAVVRAALPQLRAQRSGHIVNISSTAGSLGI